MPQGVGEYHKQLEERKKQTIHEFIQANPATYVNAIVKELSMSKTTVVKWVAELRSSKRIISLIDSHNPEFTLLHKTKKKNQLVHYDPTEEEYGQKMRMCVEDEIQVSNEQFNPWKTPEYLQNQKDLRNSFQKTKASLQEVITDFKNSNESEKKAKTPFLNYAFNEYVKLELQMEKLDHRNKGYGSYEKIMMSFAINTDYTINNVSKRTGYSKKYCSQLSKNILSKIGLKNLGDFNFKKTDPAFPKLREILGQCPHCNVWTVDALCEAVETKE